MNNHDELHLMTISHTEMLRPTFDALAEKRNAVPPEVSKLVDEAWELQLTIERRAAEAAKRGFDVGPDMRHELNATVDLMRAKIAEAKRIMLGGTGS